jgi:hypothetical protein
MLGWGYMRINNTSVCWNEIHRCVIDFHVTSCQHTKVLLILRWPHSSILMCYWLSWYLIPAYWRVIFSHVTSSQHTNVLLILRWTHPSILMFYWSRELLTRQYILECSIVRINNTSVCWNEVAWESITHEYAGMRYHENQQYFSMLE